MSADTEASGEKDSSSHTSELLTSGLLIMKSIAVGASLYRDLSINNSCQKARKAAKEGRYLGLYSLVDVDENPFTTEDPSAVFPRQKGRVRALERTEDPFSGVDLDNSNYVRVPLIVEAENGSEVIAQGVESHLGDELDQVVKDYDIGVVDDGQPAVEVGFRTSEWTDPEAAFFAVQQAAHEATGYEPGLVVEPDTTYAAELRLDQSQVNQLPIEIIASSLG